jgi:hypothetical protein
MPAFDQAGSSRDVLTRAWSVAAELVRGPSGALRDAVDEVVTILQLLDGTLLNAIPGLVKDFSSGPPSDAGIKTALSACLGRLRKSVRRAYVQLDVNRGFAVFDNAKSERPSLDPFLDRWRAFRAGTLAPPVAADKLAEAILARDLARLGALIGGRDAAKIQIDVSKLPLDLPRRPGQKTIGLLEISAAVGGAPLRYLLEFFSLEPTIDTLHQAVASGDNESIHMIWSRVDERAVALSRRELAKTAAEFHFVGVVNWILKDAPRRMHELLREFAAEHRLVDVLLGMDPLPPIDDHRPDFSESMAAAYEDKLLEWLPGTRSAKLVSAHDGRDIASINAFCDAAEGLSKTIVIAVTENGESICGAYVEPAWKEGVWACDSSESFLFTLKNHAGIGQTKFSKKGSDPHAAAKEGDYSWRFGSWEGPYICQGGNPGYGGLGSCYQDVVGHGQAIFNGGQDFFRLARWELWQIA